MTTRLGVTDPGIAEHALDVRDTLTRKLEFKEGLDEPLAPACAISRRLRNAWADDGAQRRVPRRFQQS